MRVHLAGASTHRSIDTDKRIAIEAINRTRYRYSLISFAYERDRAVWRPAWAHHPSTVIVDSGAFTAYTMGRNVSLAHYARFIHEWPQICPEPVETIFVSLDVIGDQAATWINYRRLVSRGCEVLPVVTFGSPMDDVRRAADAYPYLCLGGLVGRGQAAFDWLDQVYDVLGTLPSLPKTHLLGVATRKALTRYPCFSSDSSSWLMAFRYGDTMQGRKLPHYQTSAAASAAARKHMQDEVNKTERLMREVTAYWTHKGVTWLD